VLQTRRPATVQNTVEYQNYGEAVSADDVPPPPPRALLTRNDITHIHSSADAMSQRYTNPPSLPTSPVHLPATVTNLSSPSDSYDNSALGKVCMLFK